MCGEVIRIGERYAHNNKQGTSENTQLDFHSPYGCSKGGADQYVRDYARIYGIPTVVFRMSCIAGVRQMGNEDQGWVAHFVYAALQGKTLMIYGDGRQVRDVLNVKDLVRAFEAARASQSRTAGQIYNIGGGPENTTSLLEQIDRVEALTGRKLTVVYDECRPGDQQIYVTDFSKFAADTGWRPTLSVNETTQQIRAWWLSNRTAMAEFSPKVQPIRPEEPLSSIPIARTA
jgi:CDP-paratose 2-epimerase